MSVPRASRVLPPVIREQKMEMMYDGSSFNAPFAVNAFQPQPLTLICGFACMYFSGSVIEVLRQGGQAVAFREILRDQPVGVLIGASPSRRMPRGKVEAHAGRRLDLSITTERNRRAASQRRCTSGLNSRLERNHLP
jgi:hypothetical protein